MISIIIVNYNGAEYIAGCLNSILEHVSGEYEVIVVDNASSDQSADIVEQQYSWARLIRCEKNLGFAAGNNIGGRQARGDLILLMNNDTVLVTDLQPAAELLRRGERIGIVGADMLGRDLRSLPCAGRFPSPLRLMKFSSMLIQPAKLAANSRPPIAVDWMQGSLLFTTAENWRALSGLDEGYFMYVEDVDFCRRTADRGLRTVFCPEVRYVHFGGYDASRLYLQHAGFRRYHSKFSGWTTRMLAVSVLNLGLVARIIVYGLLCLWKRNRASTDLLRYLIRAARMHDTGAIQQTRTGTGLRGLVEQTAKRVRGRDYKIDSAIPFWVLIGISIRRAVWLARGIIKVFFFTGSNSVRVHRTNRGIAERKIHPVWARGLT